MVEYYVHPKHLIKRFEEIEGGVKALHTAQGTFYGTGTDDYIATNYYGEQEIISKDEAENFKRVKLEGVDTDAMARAYKEMGSVNLELAAQAIHSDNEAMEVTEALLKGRKA